MVFEDRDLVEGKYFKVIRSINIGNLNGTEFHELRPFNIFRIADSALIASIKVIKNYGDYDIIFEDYCFRSIDCLDSTNPLMIEEYKNCVEFARQAMKDILDKYLCK